MRFMALLLTVLTVGVAMNAPPQDICGLWVADLSKCDRGTGTQPTRLILNVTRDGNRLKVIEVTSDEVGSSVAERLYIFEGALRRGEKGMGTVETAHRVIVLRWSGRLERGTFLKAVTN
jgi:hypothetical protein